MVPESYRILTLYILFSVQALSDKESHAVPHTYLEEKLSEFSPQPYRIQEKTSRNGFLANPQQSAFQYLNAYGYPPAQLHLLTTRASASVDPMPAYILRFDKMPSLYPAIIQNYSICENYLYFEWLTCHRHIRRSKSCVSSRASLFLMRSFTVRAASRSCTRASRTTRISRRCGHLQERSSGDGS